jgi:hypothetical protein
MRWASGDTFSVETISFNVLPQNFEDVEQVKWLDLRDLLPLTLWWSFNRCWGQRERLKPISTTEESNRSLTSQLLSALCFTKVYTGKV